MRIYYYACADAGAALRATVRTAVASHGTGPPQECRNARGFAAGRARSIGMRVDSPRRGPRASECAWIPRGAGHEHRHACEFPAARATSIGMRVDSGRDGVALEDRNAWVHWENAGS